MSTSHLTPQRQNDDLHLIDAQLRAIAESGIVALVTLDPGTLQVVDVNDCFSRIIDKHGPELFGLPFADLVDPEDWQRDRQGFLDLAAGVIGRMTGEFRLNTRGGDPVWCAHSTSLVHDREGTPSHIVIVLHEITSRKESEAALLRSEERYYALLESIDQGYCAIEVLRDASGQPCDYRFLEVNPTFERHTGLKDPVGRTAREMVPGLEEHWFNTYGRVAETGVAQRFEQGSEAMGRWFEVDAVRIGGDGSNQVALLFIDITERRRSEARLRASEEALQESRRRFELAQRAASVGVWDWNLRDGVSTIAGDYQDLMGLAPEIEVIDFDLWLACIHPEDRERAAAEVHAALAGASTYFTDFRALHPDGAILHVQSRGEVLLDADGKPERMVGALVDITARKLAEAALLESERQHQLLANAMPQIVWVADANGTIRYYNDRISALAGAYQGDHGEWKWQSKHHPDDWQETLDAWRQAVEQRTSYTHEHRIEMADGHYRWHLSRAIPVLDERGEVLRWYGTATDVHELKEVERELERRRQEFETLVEHSPDIVARFDRDLRFRYINPAVEAVTGIPTSAFIGKTISELGMPIHIITIWEQHCREAFASGEEQHYEFSFNAIDGLRHFRTRLRPEPAADDRSQTLISVTYDITDRVQAESTRQSLLDALTHDLKSPLAAVKTLAQLMQRQVARGRIPDAASIAERGASFEGLAIRMTEMVDELADQARLAAGLPAELHPETIDLVTLVQQAVDEVRQTTIRHTFRIASSCDGISGEWDPRRMRRVVENLLGNAVKYSPEGGEIEVRISLDDDQALLSITDQGIGIPAANLAHIFDFHARGDNVGSIRGSGIGLAGARWIAEQHGGSISVESIEGAGSTFTVRFPRTIPAATDRQEA